MTNGKRQMSYVNDWKDWLTGLPGVRELTGLAGLQNWQRIGRMDRIGRIDRGLEWLAELADDWQRIGMIGRIGRIDRGLEELTGLEGLTGLAVLQDWQDWKDWLDWHVSQINCGENWEMIIPHFLVCRSHYHTLTRPHTKFSPIPCYHNEGPLCKPISYFDIVTTGYIKFYPYAGHT